VKRFFALVLVGCGATHTPPHAQAKIAPKVVAPPPPPIVETVDPSFASLTAPIEQAITEGKMPGCVVAIGRHDRVLFTKAYGDRSLQPERSSMTSDTVFDLASLTKPVATATSIMILVERGLVSLDALASKYVPELAPLPPFTVRQLLLHESGLVADTGIDDWKRGAEGGLKLLAAHKMAAQPGEKFVYSDAGFIVLGEIVKRVSGSDEATFAAREIFGPLGMSETMFLPTPELKKRAAPTEQRDGAFMMGDVHDPRAFALGGVAGHAGLFSTAADLSRFARAMLGRGELDGHRIFSRATADLFFTKPVSSLGGRTLGWDSESAYAKNRAKSFSAHAFGHGGFTGTALWIDPDRDLFVLFLSNRVHPDGKGAINPLVADLGELAIAATDTATGLDVLRDDHFKELAGARIGLVTNTSARGRDGKTAIDVFKDASEVKLSALFSPEHGISADRDALVADSKYGDVPVYSLYGDRFAPSADVLKGLDAIVFDLQDAGVRFYTYASTMRRAMRVASDAGLRFVVLDRPNPLGGLDVQGPIFSGKTSFVNHGALPVRHGMTMGELARLFASEDGTGTKLEVVKMKNWRRDAYFDATGLAWTSPSPNLRSIAEVVLYPALGLVEGTNVSVGRGTDAPFERLGAPWIDGGALVRSLATANLPGVAFAEATFSPESSIYKGETCHGVSVSVTDRSAFDPIRTGVAIAIALSTAYPTTWRLEKMDGLLGDARTLDAIRGKRPLDEIVRGWDQGIAAFKTKRSGFLLY
jgi:uncharacterized protein YbbC (DUF1343 family)/CubicO group peptidase (beta-lactamase class C family)